MERLISGSLKYIAGQVKEIAKSISEQRRNNRVFLTKSSFYHRALKLDLQTHNKKYMLSCKRTIN